MVRCGPHHFLKDVWMKKKVRDLTKPNKSQARKVHNVWEAANLTHGGGAGYSEEKFHETCYRLL